MTAQLPPVASIPTGRPPETRPPLTARGKRGAAIAGAVSFVLLNIGFALFVLPIVLGVLAALFTAILGAVGRAGARADVDFRRFVDGVEELDLDAWVPVLILASVVGLVVMVLALFTSTWILTAHEIERYWPITWSAAGISVVANAVIGGVASGGLQAVASIVTQSTGDIVGAVVVTAVLSVVVTLAVTATIGWLAWWWMAAAFRPAAAGSR